jgi:hypothetical protein
MAKDIQLCSATVFGERVHSWTCHRRGVVQRKGKWYCKQHDPVAVERRRKERHDRWTASRAADDAIEKEACAIAKRLGCGDPHYNAFGKGGYTRDIVISFSDAEKLIQRLASQEPTAPEEPR